MRVLSRLFRRLFLKKLVAAHAAGELQFFNGHAALAEPQNFTAFLTPLRNSEWVVYCKRPFGGPKEVLRYLARYTHRVAISNRRLIACDEKGVTFKWKDYRIEGPDRYKVMTLATHEFIRRFLMHVLPAGFHRIRYYGLLASGKRAENVARARELLMPPIIPVDAIKAISPNAPSPCCRAANDKSLPLLRRPHDHHRVVRTRRNSAPPAEPANASDQDRHVMIASSPINHCCQTYPCWFTARHSQARIHTAQFAHCCTRKHPAQPTARSFAPTRSH